MENIRKTVSAKDYEDVIEPLFVLGRITGIAPFNIIRNSKHLKLKINYASVAITSFFMAIFTYFTFMATITGESFSGKVKDISFLRAFGIYKLDMVYIFIMILYFNILMKKHVYELILLSFKDIDVLIRYLGVRKDYNKMKWNHVFVCVSFGVMSFLYILVTYITSIGWNSADPIEFTVIFYVPGYAICGTLLFFCCLANLLYVYLKVVKEELVKLFDKSTIHKEIAHVKAVKKYSEKYINEKMMKNDKLERLHLIFKTYDKICSCSSVVNKCFNWNMLAILGISYIALIFNQFYILAHCIYITRGVYGVQEITFIVFSLIQLFSNIFVISVSIKACSICESETNEIRKALSKIMIDETDEDISTKLHQTTSYLVMRYPKFSASDLFYIDTTLWFSMIGSATIYLIILVQLTIDTKYSKH